MIRLFVCTFFAAVMLLGSAGSQSAMAQAGAFNFEGKTVKDLEIGMTYDEVVSTLQAQGITLNPNYRGGMVKTDVGKRYTVDLNGQTFDYYVIQEANMPNAQDEDLRVGFSYPAPGKPQQLTEVYYRGTLGRDVTVEDMVAKMKARYGEPNRVHNGSGRATLIYGTFDSPTNFPLWSKSTMKRDNVGAEIRIYTARSTARSPGFVIHMGDADMFMQRNNEVYAIQKAMQEAAEAKRPKDKSMSDF